MERDVTRIPISVSGMAGDLPQGVFYSLYSYHQKILDLKAYDLRPASFAPMFYKWRLLAM